MQGPAGDRSGPDPRIRVLLVTKGLGHGGAERLLVDLTTAGDGTQVDYQVAHILGSADALVPSLNAHGVRVHDLGAQSNLDFHWLASFRRLLLAGRFDVVHFHLPYSAALGRPVVLSLPRRRRPVTLYTEHSLWPKVSPVVKALNRATVGRDAQVIAVSDAAYAALPAGVRRRARVVVHGIDLSASEDAVRRRPQIRAEIRAELGVPDDALLVVTVANLRSEKGYDVLLESASALADLRPPVVFAAAGSGSLAHELATRRDRLGLAGRFRFLGHRQDSLALMTAADIVVLPSHQEGLPVVLMEATSVGAAIVATAVGGVPQVVTDGSNGLLVPPGRPDDLARAIARLATDAELRTALGQRARDGRERFDVARAGAEIEAVYRAHLPG